MSDRITPPTRRRPSGRLSATAFAAGMGLCLAVTPWAPARAETSTSPIALQLPSFAPLVKKVMPAVVNISVQEKAGADDSDDADEQNQSDNQDQGGQQQEQDEEQSSPQGPQQGFPQSPFDELLRKFFQQQHPGNGHGMQIPHTQRMALGSGFIIDPSGYVVTNNHVVANADKVTVIFQDDSRHPAKVIGRDTKTDLALLKIKVDHPLPYVNWGDSNASQVGDWVLAVGNPFGLGGTVSTGVISARSRDIHSGPYDDFLQIDASINRGNSGGPTFDLNGQVIGINTAIYSPNGGSVGIGFAIPASLAKPVIEQLKEHGKVERGWLGVQIQQVTPEIAQSLGLPNPDGALVADVTADGPAAKAGFKQGDVIEAFDGHDIKHVRDLPIVVAQTPVGEKASVKVWRKDSEITLAPVLAEMPSNIEKVSMESGGGDEDATENASGFGLKLAPLTHDTRQQFHVGKDVKGVVVTSVSEKSPLAEIGVQTGDVIVQIDQQPVSTPKEAAAKLKDAKNDKSAKKSMLLLVNRHGVNQYLAYALHGNNGDNG
jgi:serine protease Do